LTDNPKEAQDMQAYKDFAPTGFDAKGLGLPDRQDWLRAPVSRTRDSGALDESNFETVLADLGGESDTVEVHRFGHWGPGWFEIILCHPSMADRLEEWSRALENYPVADESDLSRREWEEAEEGWDNYGRSDLIRALRDPLGYAAADLIDWAPDDMVDDIVEPMSNYQSCSDGPSFDIEGMVRDISRADLARLCRAARAAYRAWKAERAA
jgi:hypothetical protein